MKQMMQKEKGFTLLELLVVVAIIGILSAGALLAYEGLTDKAQAATAANNTANADQSIRNFRAVTQAYPDQWDNLLSAGGTDEDGNVVANIDNDGVAPAFVNNESREWLAAFALAGNALEPEIVDAFDAVGVEEIQTRLQFDATANVEPNLQHNEGATAGVGVAEVTLENLSNIAIVPTNDGSCTYGTAAAANFLDTLDEDGVLTGAPAAITAAAGQRMNAINDAIEDDECHLVVAFGFGHDAAHSTNGSNVAIATAPTFISQNTNPSQDYARYVALFHVAADADGDGDVEVGEVFERARLLAVVDTEGNIIDESIATANDETND